MTSNQATSYTARNGVQMLLPMAGCIFLSIAVIFGGLPIFLVFVAFALLPPRILVLAFVCVSYFRIPEAYPFLLPLKLPFVFSVSSIAAIGLMIVKNTSVSKSNRTVWLTVTAMAGCITAGIIFMLGDLSEVRSVSRFPVMIAMAFASIAFCAFYKSLNEMNEIPWGREMTLFVAFFCLVTVGVSLAQASALSLDFWKQTYWKIGAMTIILAWMLRSERDFSTAIWMLVGSGALISLVTWYNWYNRIDLVEGSRVSIGRTLFSTPEQIANAIPGQTIPGGSLLGDPNDLALVLLYPVGLTVAAIVKFGWRTALGKFCLIALPLLVTAIILTQSRSGALGVVTVFGAIGLFYFRSKLLLCLLGVVAIFTLVVAMDIQGRKSGGSSEYQTAGLDKSSLERLHAWSAAFSMTRSHPITGVGVANFADQFRAHTPVWPGRNVVAHSTWFSVMAETGLPGLALLLAIITWLLLALRRTWEILQRHGVDTPIYTTFALGLFAGLLGFCVSGTFLSQGFTWPIYLQIGFTAALSCAVLRLKQANPELPNTQLMNWRFFDLEHPTKRTQTAIETNSQR